MELAPGALEAVGLTNTFWRDRVTLVTGATGLVGGWTVRRLLSLGADVVTIVRDWVPQAELNISGLHLKTNTVRGDVCDQSLVERVLGEYEVDTVIHLAAQTIVGIANRNPISTFETNIAGTWRLLEACRRSPSVRQIVLASSDKAYGDQSVLPYNEETPLQGKHPYDVSKSAADLIAQSYAESFNLPIVISRCGNFYGGGDLNWSRIVPGTIRSVLRGDRPLIRSNGQLVRDYFYVEDGAAAYTTLAEKLAADPTLRGHAFNFANEDRLTVIELVRRILSLMDSKLEPLVRDQASNEIQCQYLDSGKARKLLGWRPNYSLEEGLSRTVNWYREFLRAE